ncbi:HAD-IB family phosphatase [Haloferula sargassicola]
MNSPELRIEVSIDRQTLALYRGDSLLRTWAVSTGARGNGSLPGSFRTPTGRFRISEKIGHGAPLRTAFRSRRAVGLWRDEDRGDGILSRILWLDGLDPENANTHSRYIYIHGTHQEHRLGQPASHGCIRMANADVIELFNLVPEGTPVTIHAPTIMQRKLIFFDCDSTLSTIEGIDELARAQGDAVFREVEALTNAAMNGEIPLAEVFPRRMAIIRPSKAVADQIAQLYVETLSPGIEGVITRLQAENWTVVILSGGFKPLIEPLAKRLAIEHVEAVPLHFDDEGNYAGYDADYPTTRNGGKPDIIRDWRASTHAAKVVMVGDGISDLESREACDFFIGYGGVVERKAVREGADHYIRKMSDFPFDKL